MRKKIFDIKNFERHLPALLAVLLWTGFFFPPLAVGSRLIFLFDFLTIFYFGWISLFALFGPTTGESVFFRRKLLWFFSIFGVIFLTILFAGVFRPSLAESLQEVFSVEGGFFLNKEEGFRLTQDGVQGFRFYVWLCLYFSISTLLQRNHELAQRCFKVLRKNGLLLVLVLLSMFLLMKISSQAEIVLGHIYGYSPEDRGDLWVGRMRGPFQSPLEACFSMVFLTFTLMAFYRYSALQNIFLGAAAVVVVLLTKTVTPLFGLSLGILFLTVAARPRLSMLLGSVIVIALLALNPGEFLNADFISFKVANLLWRTKLWGMYFSTMMESPRLFLTGFGFLPLHTDSSYLFVFIRGGLVFAVAFFAWITRALYKKSSEMTSLQKALFIFVFVSGIALDVLIFRHAVLIYLSFLAVGLSPKSQIK